MMLTEDGIVAGNVYDKYGSKNPIVQYLMGKFYRSLDGMVAHSGVTTIHEIGCGEGHLSIHLARQRKTVRATDVSKRIIKMAEDNAKKAGVDIEFSVASLYDLTSADSAPLVLCSEVLEHLEDPPRAMSVLKTIADPYLIISVPREPLWRLLNLTRLKYISDLGNTPGHIQHWSRRGIIELISQYFEIVDVLTPGPWSMLLCRSGK